MKTQSPMKILAIDASGPLCSVAVAVDEQLFFRSKAKVRSHSQHILPMIKACLEESKVKLKEIDLCVYAKGPGSFTGLRLVTAVVQGLAYSHGFNLMGISTMQASAQIVYEETKVTDIIICDDAHMNEVYSGHYQLNQNCMELVSEEVCITPSDLLTTIASLPNQPSLFGTGLSVYPEFATYKNIIAYEPQVLAPALITLSQKSKSVKTFTNPEQALPSYIRTPSYKKRHKAS